MKEVQQNQHQNYGNLFQNRLRTYSFEFNIISNKFVL